MNPLMKQIVCVLSFLALLNPAHGQVIDETIAKELGLVKSTAHKVSPGSNTRLVELNIGDMRELVFPEQGTLNMKAKDRAKFDILNVNNSLYITPKSSLTKPAIGIFVLNESRRSYILNFKTVSSTLTNNTMVIGTPINTAIIEQSTATIKRLPVPGKGLRQKRNEYDVYVELAAFGSRSAYSPERVMMPPRGIKQAVLPGRIKGIGSLLRDQRIKVKPLSAWVKKGVYLTIVELENTSTQMVSMRPELIRGAFIAKAFEHNRLGTNDANRYTAAYLISQQPLDQSLWR